jgi:ATP-dependent exoDNAse (exonuclease V) alpha subunit
VVGQAGMVELTQVRRQKEAWAREATQDLATGRTLEAINAYGSHGALIARATREEAQRQLLAAWSKDRKANPNESRLILAYTRDDVRELNREAREILKAEGKFGRGEAVQTTRGAREFAAGDRIMFLRNEKSLGVKNGTLGTVERIGGGALQVRLDGKDETRIAIETKDYQDLDYGYASTIHKSQGATVDRSYVLASQYFDRHTSYVALSRHREAATLFYAQDEFAGPRGQGAPDAAAAKRNLEYILSRARPKELAHDYLEPGVGDKQPAAAEDEDNSPEAIQARAREAWAAARAKDLANASPEEIQRLARERWQQYRQGQAANQGQGDQEKAGATKTQNRSHGKDDDQSL